MAKNTVEDCKRVQIWWLKKYGYFNGCKSGVITWTSGYDQSKSSISIYTDTYEKYMRFEYTQTDYWTKEKSDMNYKFNLATTQCNYGGVRFWYICGLYRDGRYCGRRVGVLYKPQGSKWFGCRYCFDLSYDERNSNRGGKFGILYKALDVSFKAEKLQEKIKRWHWRGRPTRKYRRLLKYINIARAYSVLVDKIRP